MKSSMKTPLPSIVAVAVPIVTTIEVAVVTAIGTKFPSFAHATHVCNSSFGDGEAIQVFWWAARVSIPAP
jgi:hypothetical protein